MTSGSNQVSRRAGGPGGEAGNSHGRKVIRHATGLWEGTSAPSPTSTLLLSVSLSSKPIRVWVPGTACKGLSATTMKGFPKQASHIQAFQTCGWRPGYSISRKAATSFDKTLLVLTPPWLRESGWVCAGGQVEVGRGEKRQYLKFCWNIRNMKQPMFTQSFPNQ